MHRYIIIRIHNIVKRQRLIPLIDTLGLRADDIVVPTENCLRVNAMTYVIVSNKQS